MTPSCKISSNHNQALRWVHHHNIPAFATESCSTLKLCCGAHRAGRCHDDGRYNRRQHSPSALCAGAKKSKPYMQRAVCESSSSLFDSTRNRRWEWLLFAILIFDLLPSNMASSSKKKKGRSCFCWSSSLFFSWLLPLLFFKLMSNKKESQIKAKEYYFEIEFGVFTRKVKL